MTEHRRINVEDGCVYPPQYDDVDYNPKVVTEPCENMQIYDNLFISKLHWRAQNPECNFTFPTWVVKWPYISSVSCTFCSIPVHQGMVQHIYCYLFSSADNHGM
jgi:hypothetical protein